MIGTWNAGLVVISLLVAILASYTALDLTARIAATQGAYARAWLIGGAFSMGVGIWSMHFIGMLAFELPVALTYDVPITLLSMIIAVIVSGFALHTVSGESISARKLLRGGMLMGLGISVMHYIGMAAMQTHPHATYDLGLVTLSVGIAIAAAVAALWMAFGLRGESAWMQYAKLGSAIIMGAAVTGMHYTGMAAAQFSPETIYLSGGLADSAWMAGALTATTLLILAVTLALSILDARRVSRTARLAASLQLANDELQRLALQDPLTRLPNRVLLEDRITQAIAHAERRTLSCAILFVDLDRFKLINDSLGHFVGDELLRGVAARLQALVRAEDTVCRLGGDEFVILLAKLDSVTTALEVATKALEALRESFRIHDHELYVTPSMGISMFPTDGNTAQMLITRADAAMYQVKQRGRNDVRVFAPEMSTFFPERLMLENDLRRAVERGEFELHYQPKMNVANGRTVGMEALVRWRHPAKGLLAPEDFMPLAEETGIIVSIGRWVIEEACIRNKAWQDAGLPTLRMGVNISGVQFKQKDLLDTIANALEASGLAPHCLVVEIAEGVVMQNASEAILILEKLCATGVHVSIDDFGTGYSSLSYLKRFPIDKLKIDRSFIRNVPADFEDAAIVRATIGLAHNLRLRVVAEGVETAEQLGFLRALGCDEYQGNYKSKPLPAVEFERFVRAEMKVDRTDAAPASGAAGVPSLA
ncbi:MAG TPA: EAL domain-containing protein [Burkholderiales bacterium]|nr:EAL domain-containing protein [Burkholderiales bacterium]